MDVLTARVLSRFQSRKAHAVRVVIDRDATLKAREHFPSMGDQIVGTFEGSAKLFRVFDGEELSRVLQSGLISGGTYSAKAERSHGASWGENMHALIEWGNRLRGKRYGDDIFLAEVDIGGRTFHHLDPKVPFDPSGPAKQSVSMDLSICSAGLGCSMKVPLSDATLFVVGTDGHVKPITPTQAKEYVTGRPAKDVDLREVNPQLLQGHILGLDVRVWLDKGSWKVITNDDRVIASDAPTKEDAIELAQMAIRMRPGKPVPMSFAILEQQRRYKKHFEPDDDPNKTRGVFALKPRDKVEVTKGSRALGVPAYAKGIVADVYQQAGEREIRVKILFDRSPKPLVLYATHANRLGDDEIALMNGGGDRILIRKR